MLLFKGGGAYGLFDGKERLLPYRVGPVASSQSSPGKATKQGETGKGESKSWLRRNLGRGTPSSSGDHGVGAGVKDTGKRQKQKIAPVPLRKMNFWSNRAARPPRMPSTRATKQVFSGQRKKGKTGTNVQQENVFFHFRAVPRRQEPVTGAGAQVERKDVP